MLLLILSVLFASGFTGLMVAKFYYPDYDLLRFDRISFFRNANLLTEVKNHSTRTAIATTDIAFKQVSKKIHKLEFNAKEFTTKKPWRKSLLFDFLQSNKQGTKICSTFPRPLVHVIVENVNKSQPVKKCTALSVEVITPSSSPVLVILPCVLLFVIALYLIKLAIDRLLGRRTKSKSLNRNGRIAPSLLKIKETPIMAKTPEEARAVALLQKEMENVPAKATDLKDLVALVQKHVPFHHRYRNKLVLGEGAFGRVYKALDWTSNKMVAVKEIKKALDRQLPQNWIPREAMILKQLNHVNIIKMEECFVDEGHYNLVLEYVSGGPLSLLANTRQVQEKDIASIAKQIFSGLEYMHSLGIVHGDIKNGNILYSLTGVVKIADFGLSMKIENLPKKYKHQPGTAWYMAPEIVQLQPYGEKVDVWAAGISLIGLLQGGVPNRDLTPKEAMTKNTSRGIALLKHHSRYSEELVDFLHKTLRIRTQYRWTASELLRHPFLINAPTPSALIPLIIKEQEHRRRNNRG